MKISEEDKVLIKKLNSILQRGYYCNSQTLKNVYNRVFETNWAGTSCSSCMRAKISELVKALRQWEQQETKEAEIKAQEALKEAEANNTQEPLKEANTEAVKEEKENGSSSTPKTRGRKKK